MQMTRAAALTAAFLSVAGPLIAADFADPTWPCAQRKVESLSMGLMWPAELDPELARDDENLRADAEELAEYLSLRRVDLEDVRPQVEAFAKTYSERPQVLGLVFADVFDALSTRRTRIINGIGEFSLSQIALAKQIDAARAEMDTLMAADDPDYDRMDALEEQLDWDQRIYTDRQQSIAYLCETPTLLERRLFGIAQMLQQVTGG